MINYINYYSHCLWRPLELHTPAAGRWWRLKESCRWDSDPLRRCLWSRPGAEVWSLLVPWLQHSQTHTQPASHRTPATTHFTTKLLFLSIGVNLISVMLAISPRCHQLLALFVKGNSDTVKYEGWLRPFFPLHNTQHTTKTPQYWKTFHSKLKAYLQT